MALRRRRTPAPRICPESHDRFGELAEEIARQVDELAATHMGDPMEIIRITDNLTKERATKRVAELFAAMEPREQLKLLVQYFGDDVLREALEEERKWAVAKTDPRTYAELLAENSRLSGKLDVGKALPDMRLTIHLFPANTTSNHKPAELASMTPAGSLELIYEGDDTWRVLDDTYDDKIYYGSEGIGDQALIFIGALAEGGESLISHLYYGTVFYYIDEDDEIQSVWQERRRKNKEVEMTIGGCTLSGVPMFYDPAPPATDE